MPDNVQVFATVEQAAREKLEPNPGMHQHHRRQSGVYSMCADALVFGRHAQTEIESFQTWSKQRENLLDAPRRSRRSTSDVDAPCGYHCSNSYYTIILGLIII
eukprot:3032661-Amphidinium_carterae.1